MTPSRATVGSLSNPEHQNIKLGKAGRSRHKGRRPQTRGQWGEITLRRLVELAGMSNRCDFVEQSTVEGDDGRFRPDMIVNLPGDRQVVIDCKAALDAFSRSIGPEIINDGVHVTTVYMPLVRTPMIAPTKLYDRFPTLSPDEAGHMIAEAIRKRPKRMATVLGNIGQLSYAVIPGAQDLVVNRAYQLFPEGGANQPDDRRIAAEQRAFAQATRGVHW